MEFVRPTARPFYKLWARIGSVYEYSDGLQHKVRILGIV